MILDIDLGNTRLKWRLSEGGETASGGAEPVQEPDLLSVVDATPTRVRIASVAGPEITNRLQEQCRQLWKLEPELAQTQAHQCGVTNAYADPSTMGVDRWLAALAAFNTAAGGCLVVDCGSAVNIEVIEASGRQEGGYIVPGFQFAREMLLHQTGKVRYDAAAFRSGTSPGVNTAEAVEHGVVLMIAAMVERLFNEREQQWGQCTLFLTGGDAAILENALTVPGILEPDLVLDGLALALP
jgi:type III pantothenate kinase